MRDENRVRFFHSYKSPYDAVSSLVVNYKGRASMASPKNIQLIQSWPENPSMRPSYFRRDGVGFWDSPEGILGVGALEEGEGLYGGEKRVKSDPGDEPERPVFLQLGKVIKDCYNLDFMPPLSPLQAFAIAISRFDMF